MSVKIAFDVSPLSGGHAVRGVGAYTKRLVQALEQESKRAREQELKIDFVDFRHTTYNIQHTTYTVAHYPYFDLFFLTLPLRKPTKTIVTIHDVIPLVFPEHYPPGIKGKLKFQVQKFSLRSVDAVITDSQNSKKDIVKYLSYPEEKIFVVYLAPAAIFKPITNHQSLITISKKYHLPQEFILYVGDVNWNKNTPGLVKACEKVKIPLVIVGKQAAEKNFDRSHPENQDLVWLQEKYQSSIINHKQSLLLRNQSSIFLTGFVPEEDLVKIYNLATVYCQPSFYEGFGLPVLEAMACGCPTVVAKTSSLPEICGSVAIMVDPYREDDIAEGLDKVMQDQKTRDTLIKRGLVQVKKFSWGKTAKGVVDVYKKVLS